EQSGAIASGPFRPILSLAAHYRRLLDTANAGDPVALDAFRVAGFHLGLAIANELNSADPGNVLVLLPPGAFELMRESFDPAVRENTMPGILPGTRIIVDVVDEDWRWKGTAALALERTYL